MTKHFADQHADRLALSHPTEVARYHAMVKSIEAQGLGPDVPVEQVPGMARIMAEVIWLDPVEKQPAVVTEPEKEKTKRCSDCKRELEVDQFYRDRRRRGDGRRAECKECWTVRYKGHK